jgi:O-succinylbenzoate-CoA ligase
MQQNLGLFLAKRALLHPHREAYVDGGRGERLTYRELNARANRAANAFLGAGVEKGDRVGLLLMNGAEFIEAYFALAKIGAVVVPLNWRLVADELEFLLKDSGTATLVYDAAFLDTVADLYARGDRTDVHHWLHVQEDAALPSFAESYQHFRDQASAAEPEPRAHDDDLLFIMYTSGTTGVPKGVMHSHATAIWGALTVAATTYYHEHERYLACLPMFHVGALTPLTVNIYKGATSVVMRAFDPTRAWELIQEEQLTAGFAVPAMLTVMLQVPHLERFDHSTLRWCLVGGSPVPVPLVQAYAERGIALHQVYGLTESCGPACLMDAENALCKIGSTGKAFFHTDVRVVDASGRDCGPNEPGEVLVRGPHVMLGYWNRPTATAEALDDGWLHTGDVAVVDTEGFVYIQDRLTDMIISGGENVSPAEIEHVLLMHPGIAEVAVIGQPNPRWGEAPFAIIVRQHAGLTEAEVLAFCQGKLAGYKHPQGVAFVDTLPRNPSGKILKRVLREQFSGPATR